MRSLLRSARSRLPTVVVAGVLLGLLAACAPSAQSLPPGRRAAYLATPFEVVSAFAVAAPQIQPSPAHGFLRVTVLGDDRVEMNADAVGGGAIFSGVGASGTQPVVLFVRVVERQGASIAGIEARPASDAARSAIDALLRQVDTRLSRLAL